jgi:hypothetical protein
LRALNLNQKTMKKYLPNNLYKYSIFAVAVVIILSGAALAQPGIICGKPSKCTPVFKFKAWDLPFSTGRQAKFKPGETTGSNEFYAVVLDTVEIGFSEGDLCNSLKAKRLKARKSFPNNKVFASDYCTLENVVFYKGFGDWHERNFLAVLVGETGDNSPPTVSESGAQAFLNKVLKKYPKAQLVKMTATIEGR